MNSFRTMLKQATGTEGLAADSIQVVQVNVGLRCNLACLHCHLSAAPNRQEEMSWQTMAQIVDLVEALDHPLVDLTGGAPELHPLLPGLIETLRRNGHQVQVRTNLAALMLPESFLPVFFRDHQVSLVASLPCYLESNVDNQRGQGTYAQAVQAIRQLNQLGYGETLPLDLVYNPAGPSLPPAQGALEADYRRELSHRHGIFFTHLRTIANMPIGRFYEALARRGEAQAYDALLRRSFNPATLDGLMCRSQITVGWDGRLYDCDFNLALGLPAVGGKRIEGVDLERLIQRDIVVGEHCLGCTAGAGSSCKGALAA